MITLSTYYKEKKAALAAAQLKLELMEEKDKIKLAPKCGLKISGLLAYQYGNGKKLETALRIVEG